MVKVILASASPRRKALLEQVGWQAEIFPSKFEECADVFLDAETLVLKNALGKGRVVADICGDVLPVLAADTVVVIDGKVLGKPFDAEAARVMLHLLSGRTHEVLTGTAVFFQGREVVDVCVTEVRFRDLDEDEIESYIATQEPLDKAGAYGIQGKGAFLVDSIKGCYNNVVGLPLTTVYRMMRKIGAM